MNQKSYLITLFFSLLAIVLISDSLHAQKLYNKRGDKYFEKFDFSTASELYKLALNKDPNNAHAIERLASCCRLTNDMVNAEQYYGKLVNMDACRPIDRFYYAQALMTNEKYELAKIQLQEYQKQAPNDPRAAELIQGIEDLEALSAENPLFEIELGTINSKAADFSPAFYDDGIIFTSNRVQRIFPEKTDVWTGFTYNQLYYATIDSISGFKQEEVIEGKQPNRIYHEGPVAFNSAGTEMYLTRSNYRKRKVTKSKDDIVKLKLFKLTLSESNGKWENMVDAVPFNSDEYSVGHASLSPDDQVLYFMSDMPGGYGLTDIYRTTWVGSGWSTPVNLGPNVNTPGKEMFPHMASDGLLYFSSDGHFGLGGLDVYSVDVSTTGAPGKPTHLGAPLNSSADDFGFILADNGVDGYFTSNRAGGYGDDDIYRLIKDGILVDALVFDKVTREPISGVRLELIEIDRKVSEQLSGADGKTRFVAKPGKKHKIIAIKDGYIPQEIDFETGMDNMTLEVPMLKGGPVDLIVEVTDKLTKEPLRNATVEVLNRSNNLKEKCQTDENGKCTFTLNPQTEYRLTGSKELNKANERYLTVTKDISTKDLDPSADGNIYVNLELERVERGVPIIIENIYYDLDKAFIRPDAAIELDKLVKVMKDNPSMEIELSSHADSRASDAYNLDLTARRAISVVNYLQSRGISKSRMIAVGYGETKLVNDCVNGAKCSEAKHQENRRTEFKILKF